METNLASKVTTSLVTVSIISHFQIDNWRVSALSEFIPEPEKWTLQGFIAFKHIGFNKMQEDWQPYCPQHCCFSFSHFKESVIK